MVSISKPLLNLCECCAFLCCCVYRVILFGVTVAFYVLLAIGVSRGLKAQLGVALIPWPYWAWWLAIISSWLWLSLGTIAVCGECKLLQSELHANLTCWTM